MKATPRHSKEIHHDSEATSNATSERIIEDNGTVTPPTADAAMGSTLQAIMVVTATTLAMMVNTSNSVSASISLPTIQRELRVQEIQLVWIVSAYPLSSGCLLLLFGRLADLYGRKMAFLLGNLWLIALTLGCAFANNAVTLSVLRGFQGIGGAAIIPASLGILAHHFPPSRARSLAFSTFAAGAPVGAAFGTNLGGVLVQLAEKTWRSIFYVNAGLAFLALVLGLFFIERDQSSEESDRRVDWIGAFLVTGGLTLIVFVLGQGEVAPQQWRTPYIIALIITGVILLVLFVLWQRHLEIVADQGMNTNSLLRWLPTPPPLMRVSLWTRANGRMGAVMSIAFLNWCCFLAWQYWATIYYQDYEGLTPILTMVRLIPMIVVGIICNVVVALFVGRLPFVILMVSGTTLTSTAALLFALINPRAVYWAFGFPASTLVVFGADFVFASGTIFVAKFSLPHEQSVAGGVFQCMTQIGTSLGVTVSTVVFNRVAQQQPENPLKSYQAAQWTNLGFGILASLLAAICLRGVGIIGDKKEKATPTDMEGATTEDVNDKKTKELDEGIRITNTPVQ
ncbi:MFS general substrate transporter [Marasmius fiardii PR-910]|nr:MFS general substrate transporter [Marasmius fiardii PR-910]